MRTNQKQLNIQWWKNKLRANSGRFFVLSFLKFVCIGGTQINRNVKK